ncbi:MAG: transcription termination/antitermination protein NusG [Candidatus Babeliales bacterium]|jgi:transcriptional antiterminator NusG
MKRWYVVQIYAGYEAKIKADLERRIQESPLNERFGGVHFPSAKMKQVFSSGGEEDQQLFPGYMLVEADLSPEVMQIVLEVPRVLRFLGGRTPVPLSQKEVDRIFEKVKGGIVLSGEKEGLLVGSEVSISEGPFSGFVGIVEKVDAENDRITVMVSIFGRMTPVELNFNQVKK